MRSQIAGGAAEPTAAGQISPVDRHTLLDAPRNSTVSLLQVPCDPKMLVAPLDPQQLAKFHLTTLEKDPKRDLVLEPDLGIPLTVFDIGRYSVPAVLPPLAPEDEALLEVLMYICFLWQKFHAMLRQKRRRWCRPWHKRMFLYHTLLVNDALLEVLSASVFGRDVAQGRSCQSLCGGQRSH